MITKEQRDAIKQRLAEIEGAHGGRLTPSDVVADAKHADSPLHAFFEWDKTKAAEAYWLDQARALITSVKVKVKTETRSISVVHYIRDPSAEHDEQGYVSLTTLRNDADLAREAIVAEFSRVADTLRRARELAKALDCQEDVESLLQTVVGLRQRFIEAPAQQQ